MKPSEQVFRAKQEHLYSNVLLKICGDTDALGAGARDELASLLSCVGEPVNRRVIRPVESLQSRTSINIPMRYETFRIRRAESGDEHLLRQIRLEALSEAPEAFGSTLDRERERTLIDWQKWLSPSATFVLETATGPKGIVAGVPDSTDAAVVHLMAMWLHPALRGSGAASALVEEVLAWAEARGASSVRLDVIDGNDRARRLYEKHGFEATGQIAVRPRDSAREVQMERRVGNAPGVTTNVT